MSEEGKPSIEEVKKECERIINDDDPRLDEVVLLSVGPKDYRRTPIWSTRRVYELRQLIESLTPGGASVGILEAPNDQSGYDDYSSEIQKALEVAKEMSPSKKGKKASIELAACLNLYGYDNSPVAKFTIETTNEKAARLLAAGIMPPKWKKKGGNIRKEIVEKSGSHPHEWFQMPATEMLSAGFSIIFSDEMEIER